MKQTLTITNEKECKMTAHSPRCSAPLPLSHAARASRGSVLARLMGLLALRRQRAQLAAETDSRRRGLREQDVGGMKSIVDRLDLRKMLADENTVNSLRMAGFRGQNPLTKLLFFRLVLPPVGFALVALYVYGLGALADQPGARPERVVIHPDDAAARGIADGDLVRVFNTRGAARARALVSDGITPGVVALPTGAWYGDPGSNIDPHGNPNVLTRDKGTSRLGQGCSAHTALVEVSRADAAG